MPTRKPPKWGYRTRYLLGHDGLTVYSEAEIAELARKYTLPSSVALSTLKDRLEGAASVYRKWKINYDDMPRGGEIRAALDEVRDLAVRLRSRLEEMDDITAALFWRPEIELNNIMWTDGQTSSRFGHSINRNKIDERNEIVFTLRENHHFESLDILANYCDEALNSIPKDKGGRRRSEALRMWVVNISNLWVELFRKRYTLDYQSDVPYSEAACFSVDAINSLDASISNASVFWAMKKVIQSNKAVTSGEN